MVFRTLFIYYSWRFKLFHYFCTRITEVAQLVEHWSPKPGVGSSSLSFRAKIYRFDEKDNYLY